MREREMGETAPATDRSGTRRGWAGSAHRLPLTPRRGSAARQRSGFASVRRLAVVLGLLAVTAAPAAGQWAGSVRDSASIPVVSNPATGLWPGGQGWTVKEDLRIGAADGAAEYTFGAIGWLDVGSDGRIYVLDAQAQHVQAFSAAGQYVRTIGGPGAGPGEIGRGAIFVCLAAGDTLLVPDLNNRRVDRYTASGTVLSSAPLHLEGGVPFIWRSAGNGLVVVQVRPVPRAAASLDEARDALVRVAPSGVLGGTLLTFPSGGSLRLAGQAPEFRLYSPEPAWAIGATGTVYEGVNSEYRIGVYRPGGRLARVITKPFSRRPVTEADRRTTLSFLMRSWREAGATPPVLDRLRSVVRFGDYLPAYAALQAGPDGTLWVQHLQPASQLSAAEQQTYDPLEDAGGREWDVFDRDGRFLGVVTMPLRFAPRVFRGNRIYGVWRDDAGVPYVMRLAIEKRSPPAAPGIAAPDSTHLRR
jgi:hypothetical protein